MMKERTQKSTLTTRINCNLGFYVGRSQSFVRTVTEEDESRNVYKVIVYFFNYPYNKKSFFLVMKSIQVHLQCLTAHV